jgi:octaprenyl-diphosphate synthase
MATAEPPDPMVQGVIRAVEAAGGLRYAQRRAHGLARQAEAELDALPPSPARDALRDTIAYAVERDS